MAGTATLSSLINLNVTPLHSSLSPCAHFPLPHHIQTPSLKPNIISNICHSKLNSSAASEVEAEEIDGDFFFEGDHGLVEDDESDEEDTESSVDLLIRFLQSTLRKVSKRAKKASRSVLPAQIPAQLVVCTLGGTVFVVILFLRVIWATISYFQSSGNNFNKGGSSFATA
ncbi:protein SHORT HYPOCOTYL IN WHITE LIGHT 1 isoform X3 [Quercus suber]|uniref:protein SHORT HYPOCOTYL IN WHITE LIGHT 1 isoform X3 n=1 Tax=Quercus suber TaxID=58331 RepID=UPI000CE22708|nr:protein SHORT HYPOCOTYL IN WHITE LIGHT 1 isoform X3 [Quercus suber]